MTPSTLVVLAAFVAQTPAAQPVAPLAPDAPVDVTAQSPTTAEPGFFDEGHVGHYLMWYGAEYLAIAAVGTLAVAGAFDAVEPLPALIGPQISLRNPNVAVLMDPRVNTHIGGAHVHEQVPNLAAGIGIAAVLVANAGLDLAVRRDLHRTHALVLGGAEAVVSSVLITEVLKVGVGRLRPDFRERYLRAACGGSIDKPKQVDCSTVPDDGFVPTRQDVLDGMKSFPSAHAANSFAALSFVSLSLGSEYLWGTEMPWWTQPLAAVGIGALSAGALYVAGSRITDNRHHIEDVLAGAGIGLAAGTGTWLLHFEQNGRARRRGVAVSPVPLEDGAGVAVTGTF